MVVSDLACFREDAGSEACRFVPMRDSEALALAITKLLGDPEGRASLGRTGAAIVRSRFDVRRHVGQIIGSFNRVLARRGLLSL